MCIRDRVTTAFFLDNMQGWAYFSCFQLEKSAAANKFNMLRNAFFEEAFNATGENGWKLSQGESADQIVTDSVKGKCARLRGNLSKNKNLMQTVKVSGKEGDVFVFGCSAVSYTHLDVYKRQMSERSRNRQWMSSIQFFNSGMRESSFLATNPQEPGTVV